METYWKVNDPYWHEPMPYTIPTFSLYQKDATTAAATQPTTRFMGLTTRTTGMTIGMAAVGLLVGVAIGFAITSGNTKK